MTDYQSTIVATARSIGHSVRCVEHGMRCAAENARDYDSSALSVADQLATAAGYCTDGLLSDHTDCPDVAHDLALAEQIERDQIKAEQTAIAQQQQSRHTPTPYQLRLAALYGDLLPSLRNPRGDVGPFRRQALPVAPSPAPMSEVARETFLADLRHQRAAERPPVIRCDYDRTSQTNCDDN